MPSDPQEDAKQYSELCQKIKSSPHRVHLLSCLLTEVYLEKALLRSRDSIEHQVYFLEQQGYSLKEIDEYHS